MGTQGPDLNTAQRAIIQQAIDYELPYEDTDVIWETQVELGPIEIYDRKNWKKIYTNEGEYSHECFNKQ